VGGWLLIYWYSLALLGPLMATCTMASDDAWQAVWFLGVPAAVLALPLLMAGLHGSRSLRWLTLPIPVVLLLAVPQLIAEFDYATLCGGHLCDLKVLPDSYGVSAPPWHRYYAPVQLALLLACTVFAVLYWVRARTNTRAAHSVAAPDAPRR
jgi:hypothetical protein